MFGRGAMFIRKHRPSSSRRYYEFGPIGSGRLLRAKVGEVVTKLERLWNALSPWKNWRARRDSNS